MDLGWERIGRRAYGMACGVVWLATVPSGAATVGWDSGGLIDSLSDPLNYDTDMLPGPNDTLLLNINQSPFATADFAIGSIVGNRSRLRNGEGFTFTNPVVSYTLTVDQDIFWDTSFNTTARLQIDGVAGNVPGLRVLNGDVVLQNDNGGTGDALLLLNSIQGAAAPRDAVVEINTGTLQLGDEGHLEGDGVVRFGTRSLTPVVTPAIDNNGVIVARYAGPFVFPGPNPLSTLVLEADQADLTFDLDGSSEFGAVEVQERAALVVRNPLADVYNGTIDVGDESTLEITQPWELQGTVRAASGPASQAAVPETAVVRGGEITLVSDGSRAGIIRAENGNTLRIEPTVHNLGGLVEAAAGSTVEIAGTYAADLGLTSADGRLEISGTADFRNTHQLGAPSADGVVAVSGQTRIERGSLVGGTGSLEVAVGGELTFEPFSPDPTNAAVVEVDLINAGRVSVKTGSSLSGGLANGTLDVVWRGDYEQTTDGELVLTSTADGLSSEWSSVFYEAAVALGGTLELRVDAASAADPSRLLDSAAALLITSTATPTTGAFDQVALLDDATGDPIAGIGVELSYNAAIPIGPFGASALGLVVEFIEQAALEGDYNEDGFVSQADLNLILLNWGDSVLPAGFDETAIPGGGPFDGLIGQNELNGVLLNWGNGSPSTGGVAVVPEPASAAAVLGLLAAVALPRRSRRCYALGYAC
ncbi:MAG: hypothetical protein AAF333_14980 [Planctomycetota bacterium]